MPSRLVISKVRRRILAIEGVTRDEVKDELVSVGLRMVEKAQAVVKTWTHKPKFTYIITIRPEFVAVHIIVFGEHRNIWRWVDRGTKPHLIPKFITPTHLFFQTIYIPRTQPIAKFGSGGGYKLGPWVAAKQVRHPGIEARKFGETFEEDEKTTVRKGIHNAFRRGVRKAMNS